MSANSGLRPYAGLAPEERRAERRRRLLDAALELFGVDGYSNVAIERLCAHARVTTRHFYQEFAGREALLLAAYDRIITQAKSAVLAALSREGRTPREPIVESIDAFLHSFLDDPRHARIACLEIVGVSTDAERHRRDAIHEFARIIEGRAKLMAHEGSLEARNFELASIAMAGATNELLVEWLLRPGEISIEELRDEIVRLFLAVIAGG
jgi:AcrR family transcriptional regulator